MKNKPDENGQKDPDPWCEEGDGEYEPPPGPPEVTSTATADYKPDRWGS